MIESLIDFFITSALILFGIALLLTLFRLIKGPTTADRVVAFDTASAILMSMVGMLSIVFGTFSFLDSILLIAIISFVSTVSISRFIEGGTSSMQITSEIVNLIAAFMMFLGSIIALISAIGLIKFQDVFLRSHASTKSSTLSVLLTLVGVIIYFISSQGYLSVRLILALVFINLTSPVGGHLISRAAYRTGAYMYRKSDAPRQTNILLSSKENNTFDMLKKRAEDREERRRKTYEKEHDY